MKRLLWATWTISLVLASGAPVASAFIGVPGSGNGLIYSAAAVMVLTIAVTWRERGAFSRALSMSASAVALGASAGFLLTAVLFHHAHAYPFAIKWGLAGLLLTLLFVREIRVTEQSEHMTRFEPEPDLLERLKAMTPEERENELRRLSEETTRLIAESEKIQKRTKQQFQFAFALLVIGGIVFVTALLTKRH